MLDSQLLQILCCPQTRQPVHLLGDEELNRLNAKIAEGNVVNQAGQEVRTSLQAALCSEDGARVYPVVDGIPVMLADEAILIQA